LSETKVLWLKAPEAHDYTAATSYLSLIYDIGASNRLVQQLRKASMSTFKAKDIFRAAMLPLLAVSNLHVHKDEQKIKAGKGLSPLLLVRDPANGKVVIADGYHRLCAVYAFDEDAVIPCHIV
jgi:hypothetical protein